MATLSTRRYLLSAYAAPFRAFKRSWFDEIAEVAFDLIPWTHLRARVGFDEIERLLHVSGR